MKISISIVEGIWIIIMIILVSPIIIIIVIIMDPWERNFRIELLGLKLINEEEE